MAARRGGRGATAGTRRARGGAERLDGSVEGPRPGAPRPATAADAERVVARTREARPTAATHRSTRGLARATGLSRSATRRIGRAFGLTPHRADPFQPPTGPHFVEKVRDVAGLYLAPPAKAIVRSVDERSPVRALDRTPPLSPRTPGQAERGTHHDIRHGTPSPFAALDVATGAAIGKCRRHRHQEFGKFLGHLDATVPKEPGVGLHLRPDGGATHKTPAVTRWFLRHPEYHPHVIPTGRSWLDPAERFFAESAGARIRRGVFERAQAPERAITAYPAERNADPKPFAWVADADAILDRVQKACERTSDSGH